MLVRMKGQSNKPYIYIEYTHCRQKKKRGQITVGSVFEVQGIATVSRYLLQRVGGSRRMRQEQTPTANIALF